MLVLLVAQAQANQDCRPAPNCPGPPGPRCAGRRFDKRRRLRPVVGPTLHPRKRPNTRRRGVRVGTRLSATTPFPCLAAYTQRAAMPPSAHHVSRSRAVSLSVRSPQGQGGPKGHVPLGPRGMTLGRAPGLTRRLCVLLVPLSCLPPRINMQQLAPPLARATGSSGPSSSGRDASLARPGLARARLGIV